MSESLSFHNLGDLIDRSKDLDKIAIIDLGADQPPRVVSYRELDAWCARVASALSRLDLRRGDRIGILAANRTEFLATYFGIMRAGFVAVPVNFKFPRAMIDYVLRDAGVKLVFCDAARRADVPGDLRAIVFGADGADGFDRFAGPEVRAGVESIRPTPGEPGMFLYTSGSTGKPKGVVLSHQSHIWVATTRAATRDWSDQRLLIAAPLYHMNALALAKFASVSHASFVLMPQFNARTYIEAIATYRCTWLTAVPPMMAMMLRERELMDSTDLSTVQFIRMGSAPVSQSLIDALRRYFPKASIMNAYGTTEAGPVVFGPHPGGLAQPTLSVGYPHPAVQLRLARGDDRNVDEGVLEMKCPAQMNGYHNLPAATAAATTDDGYYVTGDVLRRDADGFFYFVGRVDDMFVSGGENIYPGEVEKMLERHPAIELAAVVPVPDEIKGTKPVAFAVLKKGANASEAEIKQFALQNAPAYQHPRQVWFIDALPLSGTNKVDRKLLMQRASAAVAAAASD